jgi:hypothetical protein
MGISQNHGQSRPAGRLETPHKTKELEVRNSLYGSGPCRT